MEQKTLLEYLTGSLEHERILAVSDLIYQVDGYVRALAQAITGLAVKVADDDQAMRDFCAVRRNADEISAWLCAHHQLLCLYVEAQTAFVPVHAEPQDEQQPVQTLH